MRLLLLLLCTLLPLWPAWASPLTGAGSSTLPLTQAQQTFSAGSQDVQKGRYNKAVDELSALVNQGYESTDLYYNLALAYQHLNDRGHARAYYEKARLLAPWDEDVQHNLSRLRSTLNDDPESDSSPVLHLAEVVPGSWLTILFGCFHLGMWLSILAYRNRPRELHFWLSLTLAACSLATLLLLAARWTAPAQAAVIPESLLLKNGPGREFTDSVAIHAGSLVSVFRREGDWTEVEALGRVRAWLREEDICRVP